MKTWNECCLEAGYDSSLTPPPIDKIWFAYKNGESKSFLSQEAAYSYSKLIEFVNEPKSKKAFDDFWAKQQHTIGIAVNIWYKSLREEYSYLSDVVFNLCYSKAYRDCHSSDRNEIANQLKSVVEFVKSIIEHTADTGE